MNALLLQVNTDGEQDQLQVLLPSGAALARPIDPAWRRRRHRRLHLLKVDGDHRDSYVPSDPYRLDDLGISTALLQEIGAVDLQYLLPLLPLIQDQTLLLYPARTRGGDVISLRRALHEGCRDGTIAVADALKITPHPLWRGAPWDELLRLARDDRLPAPHAGDLRVITCLGEGYWSRASKEGHDLRRLVAQTEAAVLSRSGRWMWCRRPEALPQAMQGASRQDALVLIAHQDTDGVHVGDSPVTVRELIAGLAAGVSDGWPGAALLVVCLADMPDNLADSLQAAGVRSVFNMGSTALLGPACGLIRSLVSEGVMDGRRSFAAAIDRAWIRLLTEPVFG